MSVMNHYYDYMWLKLPSDPIEHVYGGGEQYSYFDLKGHRFPIWTREQGVGRNKSVLITRLMDLYDGGGGDYDTTYYGQPTFFSSRKYYCHVNTTSYSVLNFRDDNYHQIMVLNGKSPTTFYFNTNSSIKNLVQNFTMWMGQQTGLPNWIYTGAMLGIQGGTEKMLGYLKQAEEHNIMVTGLWIQDWAGTLSTNFGQRLFWNWKWNQTTYPNLDKEIQRLKAKGVRVLSYINPHLNQEGDLFKEGDKKGYFIKDENGGTYVQDFGQFYCGTVDLTNPEAYDWYKELIKTNMIELGFGGWMADFGEYLPVDGVQYYNGHPTRDMHNLYPLLWAKVNREAIEEAGKLGDVVFWTRSGFTGSSKYTTLQWAGDQNVDFSYADGMASTITAALSSGMVGIGLTHFDIGGYTGFSASFLSLRRTKELLLRSAEMSVFTPVMRTHEGNTPSNNWQVYSSNETLDAFARLVKTHSSLSAYTSQVMEEVTSLGLPAQRPLFFHYPDDQETYKIKYQYMYGSELLVAPVYLDGVSEWDVYLPSDQWTHVWTNQNYTGPGFIKVNAPVGHIPAFHRRQSEWTLYFKLVFSEIKEI